MFLIFYAILLILLISLIVFAIKRNQKIIWTSLFIIEVLSLISILIYYKIFEFLSTGGWNLLGAYMLCIIIALIYSTIWGISIIIKYIMRKKISTTQEKSKTLLLLIPIIILFIVFTLIDIKPLIAENQKRTAFSKTVITYLNNKYGPGDYKIKSINGITRGNFMGGHEYAYKFTITNTNNKEFEIQISKDNKEILEDNFLYTYYDIPSLKLEDEIQTEKNNLIPNNQDYKINFNIYIPNKIDKNYGKIPSLEELKTDLKNSASIKFKNFDIQRNFNNQEEFQTFIIDIYKHYLLNYKKYNNSKKINFTFKNGNPFFENNQSEYYQNNGYIEEQKDRIYIYISDTPLEILLKDL